MGVVELYPVHGGAGPGTPNVVLEPVVDQVNLNTGNEVDNINTSTMSNMIVLS